MPGGLPSQKAAGRELQPDQAPNPQDSYQRKQEELKQSPRKAPDPVKPREQADDRTMLAWLQRSMRRHEHGVRIRHHPRRHAQP